MKRQGQTGRCIDSGGYLVSFLQRANAEAAIMTLHPSWTCLSAQSFRPAIALLLKTGVVIWCSVPPSNCNARLRAVCTGSRQKEASMLPNHRLVGRVFLFIVIVLVTWSVLSTFGAGGNQTSAADARLVDGLAAWQQVYSVLTSPRCINCHTATNYPQQGDDRHRHFANVIRGPAGKGVPALNCASCHQQANADGTGVPSGDNWQLAPLSMRWQDTNDQPLSSAAVCRAVTDRSRNENVDGRALLKHHEEAALVLWAWNPGWRPDGTSRTLPPLSHPEFVATTRRWVEARTPCPRGK